MAYFAETRAVTVNTKAIIDTAGIKILQKLAAVKR